MASTNKCEKVSKGKQRQPTPKTPKKTRPKREDPNGPFAPRATTENIDPTKCVAARLGAIGNENQCGRDRVDGEWCKGHGPTHRAECKAAKEAK